MVLSCGYQGWGGWEKVVYDDGYPAHHHARHKGVRARTSAGRKIERSEQSERGGGKTYLSRYFAWLSKNNIVAHWKTWTP